MASSTTAKTNAVRMHARDSVAVVVADVDQGELVTFLDDDGDVLSVEAREGISYGHKIAIQPVRRGERVIKYGEPMGVATQDIPKGVHVHVHNVRGFEAHERGVNHDLDV